MFKTLQWNYSPMARSCTRIWNVLTSFLWSIRAQTMEKCCRFVNGVRRQNPMTISNFIDIFIDFSDWSSELTRFDGACTGNERINGSVSVLRQWVAMTLRRLLPVLCEWPGLQQLEGLTLQGVDRGYPVRALMRRRLLWGEGRVVIQSRSGPSGQVSPMVFLLRSQARYL